MVKKAKKEHFQNINLSENYWQKEVLEKYKLLFGNEINTNHKINLIVKKFLLISDEETAKTLSILMSVIQKTGNIEDLVQKASFLCQHHPSIKYIKGIMKSKNICSFSFQPVSIDKVKDIIKTRTTKKACPDGNLPVKLIKWMGTSFQD